MIELSEASTSRTARISRPGLEVQVHYHDAGSGDRAVVLLHGSGPGASSWSNFNRNVQPLVAAGHRVVMLDFPGWSKSDPVVCTGSRAELNANALAGLMDAIDLPKADLIGNSMGAHSAVAFALANPGRVGKLVLMGGGTAGASPFMPMPTEGIKAIATAYRDPTLENLRRLLNVFVYDTSALTEDLVRARLENMLSRRDHLDNFVRSSEANPRQYQDVGHRLGEIAAPTLIVWGRDDRFVPLDSALRLLAGLQKSELHVFSRCGHWAQWEHADAFNRMTIEFLGR